MHFRPRLQQHVKPFAMPRSKTSCRQYDRFLRKSVTFRIIELIGAIHRDRLQRQGIGHDHHPTQSVTNHLFVCFRKNRNHIKQTIEPKLGKGVATTHRSTLRSFKRVMLCSDYWNVESHTSHFADKGASSQNANGNIGLFLNEKLTQLLDSPRPFLHTMRNWGEYIVHLYAIRDCIRHFQLRIGSQHHLMMGCKRVGKHHPHMLGSTKANTRLD